jgi:hypothetical protein
MDQELLRKVGLFFFFCILDEKKATQFAAEAVSQLYHKIQSEDLPSEVLLIRVCHQLWKKKSIRSAAGSVFSTVFSTVSFQDGVDLNPWREFQKKAQDDELMSVIFVKILKIDLEKVAFALEISEGTLRYRLGRALRKLGSMNQVGPRSASRVNV